MKIVTDSGTDLSLSPERLAELDISIIPLVVAYSGVKRPAFRSKTATLPDETGHPSGANRPPRG